MIIECKRLHVHLAAGWDAVAWDADSAYLDHIQKLSETAAVDVVARRGTDTALYLEAKDYRGHAGEHEVDLRKGELSKWVAAKVRDTLAGVQAAHARTKPQTMWRALATGPGEANNVVVIFWVECSPGWANKKESKALLSLLTAQVKKDLAWLTKKVFVIADGAAHVDLVPGVAFQTAAA